MFDACVLHIQGPIIVTDVYMYVGYIDICMYNMGVFCYAAELYVYRFLQLYTRLANK
jgi:hypothetical protein